MSLMSLQTYPSLDVIVKEVDKNGEFRFYNRRTSSIHVFRRIYAYEARNRNGELANLLINDERTPIEEYIFHPSSGNETWVNYWV